MSAIQALRGTSELRKVVERAVDQKRLLDGENAAMANAEDAQHWVTVYSELLAFKGRLLDNIQAQMVGMSSIAMEEIKQIDVSIIEAQRDRYQQRLTFWERRTRNLAPVRALPAQIG